jgi:hypothetical protein
LCWDVDHSRTRTLIRALQPETVPQVVLDMTHCVHVAEATAVTGHPHSIAIAVDSARPAVCYVKADTSEELKWYASVSNPMSLPPLLSAPFATRMRASVSPPTLRPLSSHNGRWGVDRHCRPPPYSRRSVRVRARVVCGAAVLTTCTALQVAQSAGNVR